MTSRFIDKFARVDSVELGSDWTIACGGAVILDEAVLPIDAASAQSGLSPVLTQAGLTEEKTQVLYTAEVMNGPDYIVRALWAHDDVTPTGTSDPAFTLLARMTKDPVLFDLGPPEQPECYDQGYGARITCPRAGGAPILKIVKYVPRRLPPNMAPPSSTEPDGAVVLASTTLTSDDMIIDPDWDETGDFPYRGYWQETRLRIRRAEDQVVLEVYFNDRHMNMPILTFTDRRDPLWGVVGVPGFEFISSTLAAQAGNSAFELDAEALMRCNLFQVETIKDVRRPVHVAPENFFTYREVTNRVIALVEKNGDARYNATDAGQTKFDTYLQFVLETEGEIIREEGYWKWLWRESDILLQDGISDYELPENAAEIEQVRLKDTTFPALREATNALFRESLIGTVTSGGRPQIFVQVEESVNNRPTIRIFPIPSVETGAEDTFLTVEYFARLMRPSEPDVMMPSTPQGDIDVLIYGATYHALLLDTDPQNAQAFGKRYETKLAALRRKNNRKHSTRQTVARSAADSTAAAATSRIPLTRATSLESLLVL